MNRLENTENWTIDDSENELDESLTYRAAVIRKDSLTVRPWVFLDAAFHEVRISFTGLIVLCVFPNFLLLAIFPWCPLSMNQWTSFNNIKVFSTKKGFGEMPCENLHNALHSLDFRAEVASLAGGDVLLKLEKLERFRYRPLTLSEFTDVISNKRRWSFKIALDEFFSNWLTSASFNVDNDCFMGRISAKDRLTHKLIGEYATNYSNATTSYAWLYRLPLFIPLISLFQILLYFYYFCGSSDPMIALESSLLIFKPDTDFELWRLVTYMTLHSSFTHLLFNLCVQLLVGLPLESVHGFTRISAIFVSGGLAGALVTHLFDPQAFLVGASGGVYALLAAHVANVVLNYYRIDCCLLRIATILLIASFDVGLAIWNRYSNSDAHLVSFIAHIAGALSGLTTGFFFLKSFDQLINRKVAISCLFSLYMTAFIFVLTWNRFAPL